MEKGDNDVSKDNPAILILVVIFGIGIWTFHNHGLTTSEFIEILKILMWPSVVAIILGNEKIWLLISSFTDLEIPGVMKASRTASQKPEVLNEISGKIEENEVEEFKELDGFLVQNTQNALLWIANQKNEITNDAFMQAFPIITREGEDMSREKLVIFAVLQNKGLIQLATKKLTATPKGLRYLKHLRLLS